MSNVLEEELLSHFSMDATYHLSSRHHKINICLFWQFRGSRMDATKDMTELARHEQRRKDWEQQLRIRRKMDTCECASWQDVSRPFIISFASPFRHSAFDCECEHSSGSSESSGSHQLLPSPSRLSSRLRSPILQSPVSLSSLLSLVSFPPSAFCLPSFSPFHSLASIFFSSLHEVPSLTPPLAAFPIKSVVLSSQPKSGQRATEGNALESDTNRRFFDTSHSTLLLVIIRFWRRHHSGPTLPYLASYNIRAIGIIILAPPTELRRCNSFLIYSSIVTEHLTWQPTES